MKFLILFLLFSCIMQAMTDEQHQAVHDHMVDSERELEIIVPTYNNSRKDICIRNITSILDQDYDNFHVYLLNDCSTDDTFHKISQYLEDHPRKDKVILVDNKERVGAMANHYAMGHQLPDHVIVLNIDGDDWLVDPYVFSFINMVYSDPNVWITYGQYIEHPRNQIGFCRGYPKKVIQENSFRKCGLPISHLRTYYAWLFKKLKKEDLMYQGDFVQATYDKVMMVPMIEMSAGRFRCIDEVLYVYNAQNPISVMRINGVMQGKIRDRLFQMPPYEPLCDPITDFATDAISEG